MTIVRVSITLPRSLARAIDARARQLDRSRSWVVAEAARQFLGAPDHVAGPPRPYTVSPGLGESRLRQLEADLRLTPAERVRAAENTAAVGRLVRQDKRRPNQILSFDRYEDYLEWERRDSVQP